MGRKAAALTLVMLSRNVAVIIWSGLLLQHYARVWQIGRHTRAHFRWDILASLHKSKMQTDASTKTLAEVRDSHFLHVLSRM